MKTQENPNPDSAILVKIEEDSQDQRIDNFLTKVCKGVPKAHLFRIIRSGEVRVNGKRVQAKHKLFVGDVVRIPPIKVNVPAGPSIAATISQKHIHRNLIVKARVIPVVFEDEHLLVVNKPSGLAVHGVVGTDLGLIELLRASRTESHTYLELVHRIDRETSGLLIVAKKRSALRQLQEQLRNRMWKKYYTTLVLGDWPSQLKRVDLSLTKTQASEKEKRVFVDPDGDKATTLFTVLKRLESQAKHYTLLEAQILTGRTHQIRVHTSANNCPIACDDRYGDFEANRFLAKNGLRRMFLHAAKVQIIHPNTGLPLVLQAPLAPELQKFLDTLHMAKHK